MAIKVSSLGQTVLVKKVGTSANTFVKKIVVGAPTGRFITNSSVSLDGLTDVVAVNPDNGQFIAYDSDTSTYQLYSFADSAPRQAIRSLFSAAGDLTYDSATGQFSFDVESVYTKANFDSDFNVSLDEAAIGGYGLTYDESTNTLHVDSGELANYFLKAVAGSIIPDSNEVYDLGDSTHKWRALYLKGGTIYLGEISLEDSGGTLSVKDSLGNAATFDLSANNTDDLDEGSSNLYYTRVRFDSALSDNISTSIIRGYFSAAGDLIYSEENGQFSIDVEQVYTKANFDSDFNIAIDEATLNGTGLHYDSSTNTLSIGQPVETTSDVTFNSVTTTNDLTVGGNLTVNGTTTTINSTTLSVNDKNIVLADSAVDSADADGAGITVFAANASITYNNSAGDWVFNRGVQAPDFEGVYLGFDSDFNLAIDEATLNGTGLSYDSATNTLSITDTGVVSGTYGSTTQVPVFTVNAQGQIDSIGEVLVAGVTSTSYDSATGVFTINTADGGSFVTTFHDSDDRIAEIRGALSAGGDLTYNPSTGEFTFDVESVYTKANFDSDLNLALSTDVVTTTDLTEGGNLYYTTSRHDSDTLLQVDSNYVQLRQDFAYSSLTGVPTNVSSFTNDANYLDSVTVLDVIDSAYIKTVDYLNNEVLSFGNANDLQIYSNGTNSFIAEGGIGDLVIKGGNIRFETPSSEYYIRTYNNGKVALYHDNSVKFETSSTGITVTGSVNADSAIVDGINLNQTPTQYSTTPGALYFDSNELHGLSFVPRTREGATNNVIHLGQQSVIYVHNQTGEAVNRGDVVYISGTAHGSHPKISKAQANNSTIGTVALASTDIADNAHGYVTRFGLVEGLNTGGLVAGDDVYLSKDTAGGWTTTEVSIDSGYPIHIGKIVAVDSTAGTILVDPFTEHFEYLRIEDRLLVTGKIEGDSASISQIDFNTLYAEHIAYKEGSVWYDNTHKTLNYWGDDSNVVHEIGIEEHQRVYNNTGSTITKGQPLYFSGNYNPGGGVLAVPTVGLADATDVNAYNAQGLAAGDILNNSYGYCLISGQLDGVNTQSLSADTNFFVGLTPGAVQNASPTYPNYPMCLGWVVRSDSADGVLLVNQQNHSVNSFRVRTSAHIGDDLTVEGNLIVNGTQTITSTENVQIGGNIQYLNAGNTIGEANTVFVGGGLDDAFFAGHYSGDSSTKYFYVKIDSSGATDTFEWGHDSTVGPVATGITITGAEQTLTAGISIDFGATTGHTTGDKWTGTATATDTDTGFFSNRNTGDAGDGYTHLGLFFDVSENKWRLLDAYDSEPEAPIDITSPSLSYGTLVVDTVEGNLTGDVTGNADTATQLANNRAFSITGDITAAGVNFNGTGNVALNAAITAGSIVNADISATAAIADTKLATISTAGKVQNGATTATSANTASAIVARDASGNFQAGTITATTVLSDNFKHSKSTTNSDFKVSFTDTTYDQSGNYAHQVKGTAGFTYNPSTDTLTVGTLSGNASSADSAYHALSADSAYHALSADIATQLANSREFSLTGDVTATGVSFDGTGNVQLTTAYNPGSIVNADINASAAIVDTKLDTISTSGKVSNSATTATHNNTASAIVARNSSGNFSAGTITASFTGDLTGNASTADSATNATTAINATNATKIAVTEETSSSDATHRFVFIGPSAFDSYEDIKHSNAITLQPSTNEVYVQKLEITTSLRLAQDGSVTNDYLAFGTGQDARFYGGGSSDFVLDLRSDASRFVIGAGSGGSTVEKVAISVDGDGDVSTTTVTLNDSASAPSTTTNRLYSVSGSLYYNGTEVGTGGGGASVTTSPTTPSSPSDGDLWFDETSTSLFLYYQDSDTSQWVQVGGGGGGGGGGSSLSNIADSGTGVRISGDLTADSDGIFAGDVTAANFNTTSDARLKTNVRTIYDALDKTMQLRGVYFDKNGKPDIGLIAQEVEEVMPMVVNTLNDEMQTKTVNYGGLVGLLVQAIKSQQEQIDELNNKINRLME